MSRVLVIDDDLDMRLIIRAILEPAGYTLVEADDGRTALDMLTRDNRFDLILSDINMPDMNGIQLKNLLNQNEHLKDLPVIFITALNTYHIKMAGRAMGAVAFLAKPFDPTELLNKVRALVEP